MGFQHVVFFVAVNFALAAPEDVRLPPSITESPPGIVIYRNGENIELPCSAIGTPKPTYEWKKNGQPLNLNTLKIRRHGEVGGIHLIGAGQLEEGYYQCIAANHFGTTGSNVTVLRRAFLQDSPPPFVLERLVTKGRPFHIEFAPLRSYPAPQYRWASADRVGALDSTSTDLIRSKRMQWADNGDLYFSYALPEDELNGRIYKGLTFNPRVDISAGGSYTRVKVLGADQEIKHFEPVLSFSSQNVTIGLEGENITLRCFFAAYPDPEIQWTYPTSSRSASRTRRENFNTELKIPELRPSDEGDYVCTGVNARGSVSNTIKLLVQAIPTFNRAYTGPRDTNATEGDSVTFYCKPYAKPAASVVWLMDGKPLNPNHLPSRMSISKSHDSLTIRSVCKDCNDRDSFSDLMVIQCNASNKHGYAYQAGYLNVLKRTKVKLTGEEKVVIEDNERRSVSFQCFPFFDPSTPISMFWYRIVGADRHQQFMYSQPSTVIVNSGTLTITAGGNGSDWTKHEGQYVCVADNRYSRAEQVVEIQVQFKIETNPPSIRDFWWILVIVACIFLLMLLILICCVCFFCNRGDKYDVDGKERKNGNNPEKELIAAGFQDYQRSDFEPFKGSQNSLGSSARLFGDEEASEISDHGKFLENSSYHSVSYANTADRKKGRNEYV